MISPSTERDGLLERGAGGGRRGRSGDPMGVRDVEDDADDCLSVAMLSPELPDRNDGLLFPDGDPTGVSSGENRSAAQIKFDDSTVLERQLVHDLATG